MAITVSQEKKKQRYLILALTLMIFAILGVVWLGFLRGAKQISEPLTPGVIYVLPAIEIDWQLLKNLRGETPWPFEKISAFDGKFGRENPFIPY